MVWVLLGSGTVVLLIAAITKKNNEHCAKIEIDITGVQNNFFIDKKDVLDILAKNKWRQAGNESNTFNRPCINGN